MSPAAIQLGTKGLLASLSTQQLSSWRRERECGREESSLEGRAYPMACSIRTYIKYLADRQDLSSSSMVVYYFATLKERVHDASINYCLHKILICIVFRGRKESLHQYMYRRHWYIHIDNQNTQWLAAVHCVQFSSSESGEGRGDQIFSSSTMHHALTH